MDRPALAPLVVLGATGSIGRQTLDVADRLGVQVLAVAARRGSDDLLAIGRSRPDTLVVAAEPTGSERTALVEELGDRVDFGPERLVELAGRPGVTVVNGVVGAAGLEASVAALRAGNRLALANKESLVAGGPVMEAARRQGGGELLPVDSEHSAILQCLTGEDAGSIRRLILTASGGPFRGRTAEEVEGVTVADALNHPTWAMGPRISIDSATLMNKAFEVIEAHYLFGLSYDDIDVVVHPQSIVHSLVEFVDGSVKAHLGEPDMRVPIQYAITHPSRHPGPLAPFPLTDHTLTFEAPDRAVFPLLDLGYEAGRRGQSAPAVLNAADEIAVQAFLDGRIGFSAIPRVVEGALERVPLRKLESVADVIAVDAEARSVASELAGTC
ncbi:MAG: 1-deoxy-D-xylulose-5-phosphate reductoisomerase [Acidimicrobiia bacterium]|nr:1-deoxy-D-xylulose-5-phosphate reductoisomerase [Acidimicrobiia bacterium]MBT8194601.1 1-deoxy-D-xylulose-5-phosphate reductoisomerase [Acidimicrobiia bacterium]MBT8247405.1 1-deoxy-D-xylulose-5-phosphate reductoisomerase [Acidimicrobiia bacterium]NNF88098.1 1-deoxy-D-xylulose-5-phosphate reductoisomerase [Acidimicrobiia bacterium]NNJ47978.1 1-deoxy-D-xylulose-5-phosphate reductoisomerase [Acidimicrobiia bacterium]